MMGGNGIREKLMSISDADDFFRRMVELAARENFDAYVGFLKDNGASPDGIESARRVNERAFTDGVAWACGNLAFIAASQAGALGQIEAAGRIQADMATIVARAQDAETCRTE